MKSQTKETYRKIVAFIELGHTVGEAASFFQCSPRTISEAVSWARVQAPDLIPESALYVAIRQKEAMIRKYEARWQELKQGIRLKSMKFRQFTGTKPVSGGKAYLTTTPPRKTTVSHKFIHPVMAEVSYASLIRDIQNDLILLRHLKATRHARSAGTTEILEVIQGRDGAE